MRANESEFLARTAVVVGASSGIGAAVAKDLDRHGAKLYLVARRARPLSALANRLQSAPDIFQVDISQRIACRNLCLRLRRKLHALDHLVITTGIFLPNALASVTAHDWERTLNTNLLGPFYLIQALSPLLARSEGRSSEL